MGQLQCREDDQLFASRHLEAVYHSSELPGLCCWRTNFGSRLQLPSFWDCMDILIDDLLMANLEIETQK